jgi:hypothetical protein
MTSGKSKHHVVVTILASYLKRSPVQISIRKLANVTDISLIKNDHNWNLPYSFKVTIYQDNTNPGYEVAWAHRNFNIVPTFSWHCIYI